MPLQKADPILNRDLAAAYLSVIPGLGHLYKHQYRAGLFLLFLAMPLVLGAAGFLAFATFGASLVLAPVMLIAYAAYSAYTIQDRSRLRRDSQTNL